MPRLIDANALMRLLPSEEMVSKYTVANAPTVKAIPIEWLKKWAKDNSNGEWSAEYRIVINGILKDWEKENETN